MVDLFFETPEDRAERLLRERGVDTRIDAAYWVLEVLWDLYLDVEVPEEVREASLAASRALASSRNREGAKAAVAHLRRLREAAWSYAQAADLLGASYAPEKVLRQVAYLAEHLTTRLAEYAAGGRPPEPPSGYTRAADLGGFHRHLCGVPVGGRRRPVW